MAESRSPPGDVVGAGVALLEAATPLVYRANAFRVTGLPVDATARDISRQIQKASMLERLGDAPQGTGGPLALTPAPGSDAVRDAMQRLRDPERRLIEEFFWFWPQQLGHSREDEAILAMNRGDPDTATKVWSARAKEPKDAGVAVHNLAVLAHALALDCEEAVRSRELSADVVEWRDKSWRSALDRWVAFIGYEAFWLRVAERIREFDDPRLTSSTARQMRSAVPLAIASITAHLALRSAEHGNGRETVRLVDLLQRSGFERVVVDEAFRRVIVPVRERVKLLCESAAADSARSPTEAANVARKLLEQALPVVAVLDRLLPAGNALRDGAHDEVARRVENCLAVYVKETESWKVVQEVHEVARRLAAGLSARQQMERTSEVIRSNLLYGTCWFCKRNSADDAAAIDVPMHGNVTRTSEFLAGTTVRWKRLTPRVPRCKVCESAHRRISRLRTAGLVIGTLAGLVGCAAMLEQSEDYVGAGLLLVGAGGGLGALAGWFAGRAQFPTGTSSLNAKIQFPTIQGLLKQGWAVGEKPSGVQ